MIEPTYEIEPGPERVPFERYASQTIDAWNTLLSENPNEPVVQKFLEKNPSMVPGALTPSGGSGHAPLHSALITQPCLPGLDARYPDFAWIASHSTTWYPTLIEIESPSKVIFTKGGQPRHEFTQARNQLAEWRAWFDDPANRQKFISDYGIPDALIRGKSMQLHMILVYGRRTEFENNLKNSKLRAGLLPGNDEELMSYDRLIPDSKLCNAVTVRAPKDGFYEVLQVPPTLGLRPVDAKRFLALRGFENALRSSAEFPDDRREFLICRIRYWRQWAKDNHGPTRIVLNDVE